MTGAGRIDLTRMDLFARTARARPRRSSTAGSRSCAGRAGASMPEPLGRPDHLFVVREGRLALFESTAPGHEIMISLLDAGAIYSTLGAAPAASVSALEDSAVSPLSGPRDRGPHRPLPAPRPQPRRDALGPRGDAARDRRAGERDARRGPPAGAPAPARRPLRRGDPRRHRAAPRPDPRPVGVARRRVARGRHHRLQQAARAAAPSRWTGARSRSRGRSCARARRPSASPPRERV